MEQYSIHGYTVSLLGKGNVFSGRRPDTATSVLQVHSSYCSFVSHHHSGFLPIAADAMIGSKGKNVLSVYTADCQMIAILGRQNFTVLHAGRKGLQKGIIQQSVKNLCRHGEDLLDMHVFVGPAIQGAVYEVGEAFYTLFPAQYFHRFGQKRHFMIEQYTKRCLLETGILESHMYVHPDCTYQQNEKRYSRRRGDKARNRMIVE